MVSCKTASRQKGLLKVAGLGVAYLASQARNRGEGEPESGHRERLGALTVGHPPAAPAFLCFGSASSGPALAARNLEEGGKTSVGKLVWETFASKDEKQLAPDGADLPAEPPATICREASFTKPTSALAVISAQPEGDGAPRGADGLAGLQSFSWPREPGWVGP